MEDKNDYYRRLLLREKFRLIRQIARLEGDGLDHALTESSTELSAVDQHPADTADIAFERGKDVALRDHARRRLEEVEAALGKINQDQYGFCSECGAPIDPQRLEASPFSERCLDCQESADENQRPVEEEVLSRLEQTSDPVSPAYDGLDILRDVLNHGSSDSGQDNAGDENKSPSTQKEEMTGGVEEVENYSLEQDVPDAESTPGPIFKRRSRKDED